MVKATPAAIKHYSTLPKSSKKSLKLVVEYEDYAQLKAELEQFKKSGSRLSKAASRVHSYAHHIHWADLRDSQMEWDYFEKGGKA